MAAWEESAAEWSSTNFGALDSGSTAPAAEKENLRGCRGHLLLVHITHDPAGREQGRGLQLRVIRDWERVVSCCQIPCVQPQHAVPSVGTACPFQDWCWILAPLRGGHGGGSSLTVPLMALELQNWAKMKTPRCLLCKSDSWHFKPVCCFCQVLNWLCLQDAHQGSLFGAGGWEVPAQAAWIWP